MNSLYMVKVIQESAKNVETIENGNLYIPINDIILDAILQYISVRKLNEASWDVNDVISDTITDIANQSGFKYYFAWNRTVGSYGEGMGLLGNDVDRLCINRRQHHVFAEADIKPRTDELVIDTSRSHPGYCRIKFHKDNKDDSKGFEERNLVVKLDNEVYLKNICISERFLKSNVTYSNWERHGPALTSDLLGQDFVLAILCRNSSVLMSEFLSRWRKWPPSDVLEKLSTTVDCSVVAASHSLSDIPDIEYRLSFAESEKFLIRHMNDIQFAVYCYLKQVKSTVEKGIEERELLRSYYLKTVLLWTCEILEPSEWKSSNFLKLAVLCMEVLRRCYQNGRLPSVFIEENNLIGHLSQEHRSLMEVKIASVIDNDRHLLNAMKVLCDNSFKNCYGNIMGYKGRHLKEYLNDIFKQYTTSSFPPEHISLMIETETISHFYSVFVGIDMRVMCQTLQEVIARIPDIISGYSLQIQGTIRSALYRYLGDCLHSYQRFSRQVVPLCIECYSKSLYITLPVNGHDDGGLSGNMNLALFHYLNMDFDNALKFILIIEKQLFTADVVSALSLCITETTMGRFASDGFLYDLILKSSSSIPPPHGYAVLKYPALALYITVRIQEKRTIPPAKVRAYRKTANTMIRRIDELNVEDMFVDTLVLLSRISELLAR